MSRHQRRHNWETAGPRGVTAPWSGADPVLISRGVEPLKKYRKSGLEHFIKFVRELPVLSPKAIFAKLEEQGYRGQVVVCRVLSLLVFRHERRILWFFL